MSKAIQTYQQSQTQEWKDETNKTFEAWLKTKKTGLIAIEALKKVVPSPSDAKAVEEACGAVKEWQAAILVWHEAVEVVYRRLRQAH